MLVLFARSLLLVCFATLSMRLMGKRQIGQLQPFELVIAIMLADLAATPMASLDVPLWSGLMPMLGMVILHQLFTLLSLKSQRVRAFLSGAPTVVIRRGRVDYGALRKLCFNLSDLMEELRACGFQSPDEVCTAVMETSGKLSVFPRADKRAVTPEDLGLPTGYEGVPLTLILDGRLQRGNLRTGKLTEQWLTEQLAALGYEDRRRVLLCYLTTEGELTVHGYDGGPPKRGSALDPKEVCW